jgi:hypothetical protein
MFKFLCGFLAALMVFTLSGVSGQAMEPVKVSEELAHEVENLVVPG